MAAKRMARKASTVRRTRTRRANLTRVAATPQRVDVIRENEPFTAEVAAGTANTSIKLFRDGVLAGEQPVVGDRALFPFPAGLALGTYAFTARGVNSQGESALTPPTMLTLAGPLPGVPGGIFIRFGVS